MYRKIVCTFLVGLVCLATDAYGALLRAHDPTISGYTEDGWNLTYDTETGLSWLDVTITGGLSYEDVSSEIEPGGHYESFHYATEADIRALWSHAGFNDGDHLPAEPGVTTLMLLMGRTYMGKGSTALTTGLYDDLASLPFESDAEFGTYGPIEGPTRSLAEFYHVIPPTQTYSSVGSFLVTESPPPQVIPEPSTIAIWSLLGLVGLGYGWRRKRKVA